MTAAYFDEFDDRFEDDETWLDDFDDRDEAFDAAAEASIIDDPGLDWTTFDGRKRNDLGFLLEGEEEDAEDDDIAA
ncbi:hypothetical protein P12x_004405 [Tundrisphaera lichenicola]|uniref:hypothetical protein n=1 Tax=Tundrisphaera lichenicola TaxID=2029860 RepID=UPI003EB714E8